MTRGRTPGEPVLLDHQDQIDDLCARCRSEGRFAFDTEFVMEDRYETEVCLIQIATREEVALIDPFKKLKLDEVWGLVCDKSVETVVHSGQEDLALCVQHTDQPPRNVWDVQIAAGFVGLDYPISLQKLVQATLHIRLHKAKTLTDWRKRPLTTSQLRYAADDVNHLLAIRDKLHSRLKKLGRTSWANEEFRGFEDISLYRRVQVERIQRVKGAGSLRGIQLAVLKELLDWRDQIAQSRNRPARTIIKDHILVEIAKHKPATFGDLRELRGLNLSDKDVHALAKLVKTSSETPAEQWPDNPPRDFETPGETVLIALITAVLRSFCAANDLAYGLVATKLGIRDLIRYRAGQSPTSAQEIELLQGWRAEAVGHMLDGVLSGRSTLRIKQTGEEPVLEVLSS